MAPLPLWAVGHDGRLRRRFLLPDFAAALALAHEIGALAEQHRHHPDLALGWGYLEVSLWTHDAGALTELDHLLAADIDRCVAGMGCVAGLAQP